MPLERRAVAARRTEELPVGPEALGLEIALRLGLDGVDGIRPLQQEIDFRIAPFRGPVGRGRPRREKFLQDILLGQRPLRTSGLRLFFAFHDSISPNTRLCICFLGG